MMRSNTKIQINSANSDLILQAHDGSMGEWEQLFLVDLRYLVFGVQLCTRCTRPMQDQDAGVKAFDVFGTLITRLVQF